MVPKSLELVKPGRTKMEPPAQSIGNGLRLVVIGHARQVAPAGVTAQFDQRRPNHDSEDQPAIEPDDDDRRSRAGEWSRIKERTEEDGNKAGFEQLDFPTV